MKVHSLSSHIRLALMSTCLGLVSLPAHAVNTYNILDGQEITSFNSGYDLSRVEFTLLDSETLQIDMIPYGVPGDADGDGNPDASSNPTIADGVGVGPLEVLYIGMICDYQGGPCEPNLNITYLDNVLYADSASGADVSANLSMQLIDAIDNDGILDTYRLTINNMSTVKQAVLGYVPTSTTFGSFTFSAHFDDAQPDDMVPDADASTGELICESVHLEPPVTNPPPGTATIGYWKNHPADWPANCDVSVAGSGTDPNAFAMNILEAPVKGDKTISMAKQLSAAKLNVCAGNDSSCIDQTLTDASAWLNTYGPVFIKQKNWYGGDDEHETLDDYNNGKLCAPHRN